VLNSPRTGSLSTSRPRALAPRHGETRGHHIALVRSFPRGTQGLFFAAAFFLCSGMPEPVDLTPATPDDLAEALAFALRYSGRKRVRDSGEIMARIVAGAARGALGAVGICHHEATARHGGAALGRGHRG